MSIWKSPVFYLGVLLILVVTAALAAPFVVNWNAYRDSLETYGRTLTGRAFAINGDISARLFPIPRLVIGDVSLGNPEGVAGAPMLNAKTITMQLNLGGLLSGDIQVETINIDEPVITLALLKDKLFNWDFQPDQNIRELNILNHIKLDQINIQNGILHFQDRMHGVQMSLTDVDVLLSATEFAGPWRVRGTGKQGNTMLNLSLNSNSYKAGEALKFGLRIEPLDGSLPALALEGEVKDANMKGKVRLEPVVTADGRQSLEGSFKPLKMQSDILASFDHIQLDKIQITPADSKDNGTLIEGSALALFDKSMKANVTLTSPRLDLDALAGSQSLRVWRAGGVMALLNAVMKEVPETLDLNASLNVAALSIAGQNLENLALKASAQKSAIRISELSANLPGRSRMKFNGIVFPNEVAADLGGSLAFESNDSREFAGWLWPEGKGDIAKLWTGARGRLKAKADVTWSGTRFGFQNVKFELDGEAGDAELAVQLGKLAAIDLKVNSTALDLDAYLGGGIAHLMQRSNILAMLQDDGGLEKRLAFSAGKLRINGVEAEGVALDFNSGLSGFEIKKLDIGSVEGASLHGRGLVLQSPDGPSGDIKAELTADNPRGFLRLIGAITQKSDPPWVGALGATRLQGSVSVKPGTREPLLTYDISGQTGALQVAFSGDLKDIAKGNDATLGIAGEINSPDSSDIFRVLGFDARPSSIPGKLVLTSTGSNSGGFRTNVTAEAFGAKFGFDGRNRALGKMHDFEGKISLMADDTAALGAAWGLPLADGASGPTALFADVAPYEGGLQITKIAGTFASRKISGRVDFDKAEKLNADLAIDHLDLRDILSAGFFQWQGKTVGFDEVFSNAVPLRSGEVWIRPEALKTGIGPDLAMAVVGLSFNAAERQVTVSARGKDTEPWKLDVSVRPKDGSFSTAGSLHVPVEVSRLLRLQDGTSLAQGSIIFDGNFQGEGRGPLAVMTGLKGNATYVFRDAKLTQISPQNFFKQLSSIKNAEDLKLAFDVLLKPPGFDLSAEQLAVSVQQGVLIFAPLEMPGGDADLKLSSRYDLSSGDFETRIDIVPKPSNDVPPFSVTYSGAPGALRQRTDTAEVANKLGFAFMARDLAELEKVQREQARLAAEELAQQKSDEEKFAAFQAQRYELRLRLREQKVFSDQRVIDAERSKEKLVKMIKEGAAMNAGELQKYLRQLSPAR